MSNLREKYNTELKAVLQEKLGIKNVMAVPKLTKVVSIWALVRLLMIRSILESAVQNLTAIAGQKPVITKARKSVLALRSEKVGLLDVKLHYVAKKCMIYGKVNKYCNS